MTERVDLEKEHWELADRLELCVSLLQEHIRCLKGEHQDLTGLGMWQIFCQGLERAVGVKVITVEQWDTLVGKPQ